MQKILRTNKYLLCIILSCAMLFTSAGAYEFTGTADNASIEISYDLPEGTYGTLVYVFDTKVEADAVIDETLMNDHLIYVGTQTAVSIELAEDAPYGVYTVVIGSPKAGGREGRTKYILRALPEFVEEAMEAVFGASDATGMATAIEEYNNKAYVLSLGELDAVKGFMFDLAEIKGIKADTATSADIEALYAEALEFAAVKTGDKAQITKLITDNSVLELDSEDIAVYAGAVADALIAAKAGIDSLAILKSFAQESLALAALNGALTSKTIDTIEKYNDIFNADIPSFDNDTIRYEVEKVLESTEFTDVTAVDGILDDAYKNAKEDYEEEKEETQSNKKNNSNRGGSGFYMPPSTVDTQTIIQAEAVDTSFKDLGGYDWAQAAINHLYTEGIIKGDGSGNFRPQDYVTREELVKMIIEAIGGGRIDEMDIKFTDVADDAWYKPYIATAYKLGIVTGETEATFGTGKPVTRQDAAVMILRAADAYYITFAKKQTLVNLSDFDTVSDYARVSVDTLARTQIINGFEDGTFRPHDSMTRAETAKVIYGCISVN